MKINYKKGEQYLNIQVETLYNRMFKKWYSGNDEIFSIAIIHSAPKDEKSCKSILRNLLMSGNDIRTGYTSTSVRGFYDYHIFEILTLKYLLN